MLKLTPREIERALPNEHPSTYYLYAARLWGEGHRDDAVFWLYAGQLRFRFHLLANPNLPRSGDPALIASLQATIGEPINLFVGGDLKNWRGQIARVLAWDEKTVNGFTSKTTHAKILAETRAGLEKLSDHIEKNADTIRAQREQEGIGTIGVVKGTYIEERKRKMPKEWPALSATTKLADLAGSYGAAADTALAAVFFAGSPAEIFRASAFRLTVVAPDLLEISAPLV